MSPAIKRAKNSFVYAAVYHVSAGPNPIYAFVDRELDHLQPQVVVIEGVERSLGLSPHEFLQRTASNKERSESIYTAHAAKQRRISFIGGEPDDKFNMGKFIAGGYEAKDYIFYTVVRQIGQWKREKGRSKPNFRGALCRFRDQGSTVVWA